MILNWIKAHPVYTFAGVLVVVLLLLWFTGIISGGIERIRANKFDKQQEAYEQQIADLKVEREKLIKQANDAEAKALLKEAESKELRDLIAARGGAIEAAAKEMEKKLEDAKQGAGNCAGIADSVEQRNCLCSKLRASGFDCQ